MQQLSVDDRLVRYLLDRARVGSGQEGLGRLSTTHERIAADLWTAREVVSRSLKTLERDGLVVVERGAIVVKNPQALAARAARLEREH